MLTDAAINERVGVLPRRESEARILTPMIEAVCAELGREPTLEIVARVIAEIARKQGREVAERVGGRSIADLARAMEPWWRGGALPQEVLAQTPSAMTSTSPVASTPRCTAASASRSSARSFPARATGCSSRDSSGDRAGAEPDDPARGALL